MPLLLLGLWAAATPAGAARLGAGASNAYRAPSGPIYYVATDGDDARSCSQAQDIATPKRTLHSGAACLAPGDTLYIRAGTYDEEFFYDGIPSGTSWDAPVTLAAYNHERVVLRPTTGGCDGRPCRVFTFVDPTKYVVLDGLVMDAVNVVYDVVKITCRGACTAYANHIRIQNSEVMNAPGQGILVGSDGNQFIGLRVHDNGTTDFDHGIYFSGNGNLVEGSEFYRNAGWGIHKYPDGDNSIIRDNRVHDNARVGNRGPGIGIYGGSGDWVYNNLVWGNNGGIVAYYGESEARIIANTVYDNARYGILSDAPNSTIRNNIVVQNGGQIDDRSSGSTVSDNLCSSGGPGCSVVGDPMFVDPGGGDFHLADGSPAIDAGSSQDAPATDFEGDPRPQGAAVDIGADEYRVQATTFADVPAGHWAYADIEKLYQGGYVAGCQETPERKYCPEDGLTRAEAAVFVERGVHGGGFLPPEPGSLVFSDVALGTWHAKWVHQLWQDGFTAGCASNPLRFCPDVPHTRAEATVFFLRMLRGKDYLPPEPPSIPYSDVAPGTWYFKWVAAAYDAGLTRGCEDLANRSDDRFRPEAPITRAEAACVMARAKEVSNPPQLAFYQQVYDSVYEENKAEFDAMAASGDTMTEDTYYYFQYVLTPTISMFEATGERKYLDRALAWAETMVSKAVIIDRNGNRNWSGSWESPYASTPISYQLYDLQGSTELARLARLILTTPSLNATVGDRARALRQFVRDEIVEKHVWARGGLPWFVDEACTARQGRPFNDKVALLMRILRDVYLVSGEARYGDLLTQLAQCFKQRFTPYQGALIWDLGIGYEAYPSEDTSHGARHPWAVVDLAQAGMVFTADDVHGLARLFTDVIWNQSLDDPRFTNFIDGSNGPYGSRGPWGVGRIYSGWEMLGQFSPKVQEVAHATLVAIMEGKSNPSLDYNATSFGKLSLAGNLAKNAVSMP